MRFNSSYTAYTADAKSGLDAQDNRKTNDDDNDEDEEIDSNVESSEDDEDNPLSTGRKTEEVNASEIHTAIIRVLQKCPNNSCTVRSLASRVLKELEILTRGNPRVIFERRVMRVLNTMEEKGMIEKYKAKNNRIRLLKNMVPSQSSLF